MSGNRSGDQNSLLNYVFCEKTGYILTDPNGYSEEIYSGWVSAWRLKEYLHSNF